MSVEDAVSAQFAAEISAFAKPTFERLRRTRHTAQYVDPSAAPITELDAAWAIEKAAAAVSGVKALLAGAAPERFAETPASVSLSIGRLVTLSWNDPDTDFSQPASRTVAWTGLPSRSSAALSTS